VSAEMVQKIADAVLYEGYMLYPYRPSSVKNRQRWTFGGLYPQACAAATGDRSRLFSEVLVRGEPLVDVKVKFLHLIAEEKDGRTWQVAQEREVEVSGVRANTRRRESFRFGPSEDREGAATRRQEEIGGLIEIICGPVEPGLHKLSIAVSNTTDVSDSQPATRDEASMRALVAAHAILRAACGEFISLTDPPDGLRGAASGCVNEGVWPVLAGEPGSAQWMLVSPIILYDYPQIAPESPGDLFDGTEIDEILTLRVLTMTDQEKDEMRRSDPRLRELLQRTESLRPEEMMKLHGALRNPRAFSRGMGQR